MDRWERVWIEEPVDTASVHEVDADETGEDERAPDDALSSLSQTQQQERDEGSGNLDAHSVF